MAGSDCFICDKHAQGSTDLGGIIYEDDIASVGHLLPTDLTDVYLGYLMVEPKRHVEGLDNLSDAEAASLGVLVRDVARVLKDSERVEHVYSFVLGDAVPHLHIHVVPRYEGTPREYWGARVGEWPDAPRGGEADIAVTSDRLRHRLAAVRHDSS